MFSLSNSVTSQAFEILKYSIEQNVAGIYPKQREEDFSTVCDLKSYYCIFSVAILIANECLKNTTIQN